MRRPSLYLVVSLLLLGSENGATSNDFIDSTDGHPDQNRTEVSQTELRGGSPFTIYYGLNESHSKSWVQRARNGTIGVTYFQRTSQDRESGTLLYQAFDRTGSTKTETVTSGSRLEISVLLFDSLSQPHIFAARSNDNDQIIDQYSRDENGQWTAETILHFWNEGGRFIYELSADVGPDDSFHFLILKTRSDIDSDDFNDAWHDSYLYHLTKRSGKWEKELIQKFDMVYTWDMYIKTLTRQDIKVDRLGYVHVAFGKQIHGDDFDHSPSRLFYATNKTGKWVTETVLSNDDGVRDEAAWFPSLFLDHADVPHIACMYLHRVATGSASYSKLVLVKRQGDNAWTSQVVADGDDGYHGPDGRRYTGALPHLVFDSHDTPHIIFSDVASSHWGWFDGHPVNELNVGNVRYGTLKKGAWNISTIYRQPLPTSFVNATEMHGMCLLVSDTSDSIWVIGQELISTGEGQYTCRLINVVWSSETDTAAAPPIQHGYELDQNYPNPFSGATAISYSLSVGDEVSLRVRDVLGREVGTLVAKYQEAGSYVVSFDGSRYPNGAYFYTLQVGDQFTETKKMAIVR